MISGTMTTIADDDAEQRRTIAVMLRVPPEQLARIEAGARALGLKRGPFFIMAAGERALGLTAKPPPRPPAQKR
jgi:hypothetical protein